jgi:hypothetical protein
VLAFQLRSTECCTGTVPVPDSVTDAGEFVALLTNETVPEAVPLVWGANEMVTLCVPPGPTVNGKLAPVRLNPIPVKFAADTDTAAVPVFDSVTVLLVELPSTTLPKLTLVGEALSKYVLVAVAAPDNVMAGAVFEALLATLMDPVKLPVVVGANRTPRLAD